MSELSPISQAILDYIQTQPSYIEIFRMIHAVHRSTGAKHTTKWYFRRLACLALEGRIEAKINRKGDNITIRFRRLPLIWADEIASLEDAD